MASTHPLGARLTSLACCWDVRPPLYPVARSSRVPSTCWHLPRCCASALALVGGIGLRACTNNVTRPCAPQAGHTWRALARRVIPRKPTTVVVSSGPSVLHLMLPRAVASGRTFDLVRSDAHRHPHGCGVLVASLNSSARFALTWRGRGRLCRRRLWRVGRYPAGKQYAYAGHAARLLSHAAYTQACGLVCEAACALRHSYAPDGVSPDMTLSEGPGRSPSGAAADPRVRVRNPVRRPELFGALGLLASAGSLTRGHEGLCGQPARVLVTRPLPEVVNGPPEVTLWGPR